LPKAGGTQKKIKSMKFRKLIYKCINLSINIKNRLEAECHKEVMESFQKAETQKRASPTQIFDDVYHTLPAHLVKQKKEMLEHIKLYKKEYPLELYEKF
jgi:TPP-dependent pyruvate/acetoin dehydrogenase alpha subunit